MFTFRPSIFCIIQYMVLSLSLFLCIYVFDLSVLMIFHLSPSLFLCKFWFDSLMEVLQLWSSYCCKYRFWHMTHEMWKHFIVEVKHTKNWETWRWVMNFWFLPNFIRIYSSLLLTQLRVWVQLIILVTKSKMLSGCCIWLEKGIWIFT